MSLEKITGSYALLESLLQENVRVIFGYPGGSILPVYDALYDYKSKINHMLVRHEQAAVHAAEGFARVSSEVGVVLLTSGPGATNAITGIADAMLDSTPIVVIAGQVSSTALGTDAFQETDLVGITQPLTKWSYQIRRAEDVAWVVARAFYIARSGRPGPVVLDFTKDAQQGLCEFSYKKCTFIRSYIPEGDINLTDIETASNIINMAKRPMAIVGQGVILGEAEKEVLSLIETADIPTVTTLMGLSAIPTNHPLNKGMIGTHGSKLLNQKTNECDVLLAIGMRFSERVVENVFKYAEQAQIIHFDIDHSEINKNVEIALGVEGNVKKSIALLNEKIDKKIHSEWVLEFSEPIKKENLRVGLRMKDVVKKLSLYTGGNAILVTDVGQNQIASVRYFSFSQSKSIVTSGGLGTMGFAVPAAIGAKIARPNRTVCVVCGDGGFQMTMQELGTIMEYNVGVKIIIMNNNKLGMVHHLQDRFCSSRYSFTDMKNPDFCKIAAAYNIKSKVVTSYENLDEAMCEMFFDNNPFLLVAEVEF